jgi:FtsH-binding integral membrane protein
MAYIPTRVANTDAQLRQSGIISQVYAWMTAGLLVTGAVAAYTANSPALLNLIFGNPFAIWILFVIEIGMVIGLSGAINRLSPGTATALFLAYSTVTGLTISSIFLVYTSASIASTFFITGSMFGVLSLYGYVTQRDLTRLRNLLVMALIGFFIASLVNFFLQSAALYWIVTYAGILIFVGLIASDTQKVKRLAQQATDDSSARRLAILGSLILYLDFINLFLLVLRLFGGRRD